MTNNIIAQSWIKAFNDKDLEALLNLYDGDAIHYSPKLKINKPETKGYIKGREALREWWQDAFNRLPTLHYQLTLLTTNSERVFMEYIRKVSGEEDLKVAEVLEIKNNVIVSSRVYHG